MLMIINKCLKLQYNRYLQTFSIFLMFLYQKIKVYRSHHRSFRRHHPEQLVVSFPPASVQNYHLPNSHLHLPNTKKKTIKIDTILKILQLDRQNIDFVKNIFNKMRRVQIKKMYSVQETFLNIYSFCIQFDSFFHHFSKVYQQRERRRALVPCLHWIRCPLHLQPLFLPPWYY